MANFGSLLNVLWYCAYGVLLAGFAASLFVTSPVRRKLIRILLILGCFVVGAIFLAAAYGKMKPLAGMAWSWPSSVRISLASFAIQVDSYQVLSPGVANTVAHILPYFELFLGVWLVSNILRRFSSLIASLTICGFIIAIASAYLRGLKIDCGCGIGPPEQVGPAALLRDGLRFLLPAVLVTIGAFWIRKKPTSAPVPDASSMEKTRQSSAVR